MTNKQPKDSKPPSGTFTTVAVLVEDINGGRSKYTGNMTQGNFLTGGDLVISVVAKDPYSGQPVRLDNVKVESNIGTLVTGIPTDGIFELNCQSYEQFCKRIVSGISARPIAKAATVQNQSLPDQVKIKDSVDNMSNNGSTCRQYDINAATAAKHLGLLHERDDLRILQGPENGRSPGVVVAQGAGEVSMFSVDGKQNVSFSQGTGLNMRVASIEVGGAIHEINTMQYGGISQIENPMMAMVPQGTILTPQPWSIPNVQKIVNFIATVTDMVDLINACSTAVSAVMKSEPIDRQKAIEEANKSSFEDSVTTSQIEKDKI